MNLEEQKPPIGIMPERIWKQKRAEELTQAITRYVSAREYKDTQRTIIAWCHELESLVGDLEVGVENRIPFTSSGVKVYLDRCIRYWRGKKAGGDPVAGYYVDAFQSVRTTLFGETLPLNDSEPPDTIVDGE